MIHRYMIVLTNTIWKPWKKIRYYTPSDIKRETYSCYRENQIQPKPNRSIPQIQQTVLHKDGETRRGFISSTFLLVLAPPPKMLLLLVPRTEEDPKGHKPGHVQTRGSYDTPPKSRTQESNRCGTTCSVFKFLLRQQGCIKSSICISNDFITRQCQGSSVCASLKNLARTDR